MSEKTLIKFIFTVLLVCSVCYYFYSLGQESEHNSMLEQQLISDRNTTLKYNLVAQELENLKSTRKENAKTITKTIEKIVTRDVYHTSCIDADGLLLVNTAIKGNSAPTVSNPTLSSIGNP